MQPFSTTDSGSNDVDSGVVAVLTPQGDAPESYFSAVSHGSGIPVSSETDRDLPDSAAALLVIGVTAFDGHVPKPLAQALKQKMPVLGVGWGMHALNVALGGDMPVAIPEAPSEPTKSPIFISPGAKLSYTIAGSGWVSVPFSNSQGLRAGDLATGLMASCYREDGFIAAFELPGRNWTIGVQWNAHEIDSLPSGFDSLLLALVERAAGIQ